MEKVTFKTRYSNGVKISITPCTQLSRVNYKYVGSNMCLACSYCCRVNTIEQYVVCRKKITK